MWDVNKSFRPGPSKRLVAEATRGGGINQGLLGCGSDEDPLA